MDTTPHPYRRASLPIEERIDDLLGRMSAHEKAALMFHTMAFIDVGSLPPDGEPFTTGPMRDLIVDRGITHFNIANPATPDELARFASAVALTAAGMELGIPVTLSSDPRHATTDREGVSFAATGFSQWPEPIGIAATRDAGLAREFGEAVGEEFAAAGIRGLLGPQVDLATEPRWSRISGTFGGDPHLTAELGAAFIEGAVSGSPHPHISVMVKHFPGGGPQKDGEDPHFPDGKEQVYPGGRFEAHLEPFAPAFAAGATQTMVYYGMPVGTSYEEVGFAFNTSVITGLLRERFGFDGIVSTDWGVITDHEIFGEPHKARAWGVEHLDVPARMELAISAGVDQFGGESDPGLLIDLLEKGRVSEARVDASARRILREKFRLGLFDDGPIVLPVERRAQHQANGRRAQLQSITLLSNDRGILPLTAGISVYSRGISEEAVARHATVAPDVAHADLAIVRLATPYEPREGRFRGMFHSGSLAFGAEEIAALEALASEVPTIVVVTLERPAILTEIVSRAAATLVDYGSSDEAVLDVLFGAYRPEGRLPFQLPRSMADVTSGDLDVPHRFENPLFDFGYGLSYSEAAATSER